MLKVVIIGYGEMFTSLIAGTLDANCDIAGVLRKDTIKYKPAIRKIKDIINPSKEYNYIKSYNIPEIIAPNGVNSKEFKAKLIKLNPDIILVGSWGEKLSKEIYDFPKIAAINVHPSLLPKYRGPNPYYWAIRNGESESGVTFHLIDSGYDTGAILAQETVKIYPSDTGESLKKRTVLTARGMVCELLNTLKEDLIIPLKQNEEKASYYSYPNDYELDFTKTAEENHRTARAIYPWDRAYFCHKGEIFCLDPHKTFIEDNSTDFIEAGTITFTDFGTKTIEVVCGGGKVLKMTNLSSEGILGGLQNYLKYEVKIGEKIN